MGNNPALDINDVYAWNRDSNTLALIMTVSPFATDTSSFSTSGLYVFNIYRDDAVHAGPDILGGTAAGADLTRIICQFAADDNVACWVGENDYVTGDPSDTAGLESGNGTKVYAGLRHDPFFFDLDGFNAAVGATRAAVPGLVEANAINSAGCPDLDSDTVTALQGLLAGGENAFAELNTLAIVIEVSKDLIDGSGEFYNIYGSTHQGS